MSGCTWPWSFWAPFSGNVTPIITFSYAQWSALFPEFSNVSELQAGLYSGIAAGYVDLSGCSPMANNTQVMAQVWNLVTAHVAKIFAGSQDSAPSDLVGRISDASQGSVSVSASMPENESQIGAWFNQTKYGAAAYTMMQQFVRGGLYVAPVTPLVSGPWPNVVNPPVVINYPFLNGYS